MIERTPRWLLIVGIVTAAIGCDNVSWGGMSFSLEGPPADSLASPEGGPDSSPADPQRIEYGPLLYAGFRQEDSATVVPVAELVEGGLHPLPAGETGLRMAAQVLRERLLPGKELALFQQGSRIGTLILSDARGTSTEYCSPRAEASGHIELIPSAAEAQKFLALEESEGRRLNHGSIQLLPVERSHRIAALNLGGEALNELRAQWPAALQNIRQDLQVFQPGDRQTPSIAATFLFQDQLSTGLPPDDAYALLILGEYRGTRWERTYTWYRRVGDEGKGAPRFFSKMDWDHDGQEELLLEVFGADSRWWAALDMENGRWTLDFQDPCGAPGVSSPGPEGSQGGSR